MEASDSLSRTLGMDFFIPFPFPNFGNGFFSFPYRSRTLGMDFFIPFPFPNFGNGLFQFPSRSRTLKSHSRSPLIYPNQPPYTAYLVLDTWNLFGSSAILEKVGQKARVTMAGAPLQCIRGWYLFIIPPDFYNTMSLWTIFVAHQRSAQVSQCRVTQAKDLHWSRYHSDVNHFLHCGHQISESGYWPICEVACIMLLGSSNFS